MPIYEYRCSACGFEKDALQKMSDAPLIDCPQCGAASLVKLISAAGFHLKGSGWYATDFKGSGKPKADVKPAADSTAAPAAAGAAGMPATAVESAAKSQPAATKPAAVPGSGD